MKLTLSQIRAKYSKAETKSPLFYRETNGRLYATQFNADSDSFEMCYVRGSTFMDTTQTENRLLLEDDYVKWDSNDPRMAASRLECMNSAWKITMQDGTTFRTNFKPTFRAGGKLLHLTNVYSLAWHGDQKSVDYYMEMSVSTLSVKEIDELKSYAITSRLNHPNPTDDF